MDKIVELLKTIGASNELATSICEELKKHEKQVHIKYNTIYKEKLGEAKKLCVEEVEKYKLDLSKKVALFLESKSEQIDKRLESQRAIEEDAASSKLRSIHEIVENIEVADDAELQALKTKIKDLSDRNQSLTEDKKRAEAVARRANKLSKDILKENKELKTKIGTTKEKTPVTESTVTEGKETSKSKKKSLKESLTSVVSEYKAAKPKTTRRTLIESQTVSKKQEERSDEISQIANQIQI